MERSRTRSLEISIISAEDLHIGRHSLKKTAFVTVEIAAENLHSTSMDSEGGSFPTWYEKFELPFPYNIRNIKINVKCKQGAGVSTIGSVTVPVSDFLEDYIPPNCVHFLSYRLREPNGNPNGIINFSVRVKGGDSNRVHQTRYGSSYACGAMPASQVRPAYINGGDVAIGVPMPRGFIM